MAEVPDSGSLANAGFWIHYSRWVSKEGFFSWCFLGWFFDIWVVTYRLDGGLSDAPILKKTYGLMVTFSHRKTSRTDY
jgi:hypothetical protein